MPVKSIPKNVKTTVKTRNTKNKITRPITAAVIVPLAPSTAALSPPEYIHFTAPKSKKKIAIITAMAKIKAIADPIIVGI